MLILPQHLTMDDSSSSASMLSNAKGNSPLKITDKEDTAVGWSRGLVFAVLAAAAGGTGFGTHKYVSQTERSTFAEQFDSIAQTVVVASQNNVLKVFGVLEGLSNTITTVAKEGGSAWPYQMMQDYEVHARTAKEETSAILIAFVPRVSEEDRAGWENYSVASQGWIMESYSWSNGSFPETNYTSPISSSIWTRPKKTRNRKLDYGGLDLQCDEDNRRQMLEADSLLAEEPGSGPYAPLWLTSPPPPPTETTSINYNLFDRRVFAKAVGFIEHTRKPVFLDVCVQTNWFPGLIPHPGREIQTVVVHPVFEDFFPDSKIVGYVFASLPWTTFFDKTGKKDGPNVQVVMRNTCNEVSTYDIEGFAATFIEETDTHDQDYNNMGVTSPFADFANPAEAELDPSLGELCVYNITVYPTKAMEHIFRSYKPIAYAFAVVCVFLFTSVVFLVYDIMVRVRQTKVLDTATRSHAIVSSLFPDLVRDQLLNDTTGGREDTSPMTTQNQGLPIAEFFPSASVVFMDIAGFTCWSSARDPSQVFQLLEALYNRFDCIAKKYHVFKVETIGDCYVACTGIPKQRQDHAMLIATFAVKCMCAMKEITHATQASLGPDTADLDLRIGMHSGAITAGVLRGERFQLFGDTVNTASRMESNGLAGRIQASSETAQLLRDGGMSDWVFPRKSTIEAKGKGSLKTVWISSNGVSPEDIIPTPRVSKTEGLIAWNYSTLLEALEKVVLDRKPTASCSSIKLVKTIEEPMSHFVRSEIVDTIEFPSLSGASAHEATNSAGVPEAAKTQLLEFISVLASLYKDNYFHNFAHASHVGLSVKKMLNRILDSERSNSGKADGKNVGVAIDNLTVFAVILAAVVHDIDHDGVDNKTLAKINPALALTFGNKSVAEQSSVSLSWNVLMADMFADLRACIYQTKEEYKRFRQLLVNSVMSTDIFDPELVATRQTRWDLAFGSYSHDVASPQDLINRKTTVVIDHLIRASDVSHCMQHWCLYQKWNHLLFLEQHSAFTLGKLEKDPSIGWFDAENWFFDNYVLPLAANLKDCGAFGVTGDEFYSFASRNRLEWKEKGRGIVEKWLVELSGPSNCSTQTSPEWI